MAVALCAVLPAWSQDHSTDPGKYYLMVTDVVDSEHFL